MQTLPRRTVLAAGAAIAATAAVPARAESGGRLELVANFSHQVTGVAASPDGRVFVNFPRWEEDVAVSVAEVDPDGKLTPYPDAGWNAWRNAAPLSNADHFVCVQSVVCDGHGKLWVVDAGAPGNEFELPGAPKLVAVDLATNAVVKVIPFGFDVMPQGSYLNDIRFSPDGRHGVLTDSGQVGALLVADLAAGTVRRLLNGHFSTQVEKGTVIETDGKPLTRPDGRGPMFAADGIAIDPQGRFVTWQALTGRTQYRIPLATLLDVAQTPEQVAAAVETLGKSPIADAYFYSSGGILYVTSPEDNSVKRRDAGGFALVVKDERLRWPDSMAEGKGGILYVTASHIQDMAQYKPMSAGKPVATALFRFAPEA